VILGDGTSGTVAAWTFASEGRRVAVIERKYIGGSFPNIACLRSKNVIHSAKVASFRRSEEFGIPQRNFAISMHAVRERKRRMVSDDSGVKLCLSERAEIAQCYGHLSHWLTQRLGLQAIRWETKLTLTGEARSCSLRS
jgi:pyruvate/2-oxoglutarate dehydrogenase complex dihydrolipoamide dehydrogenase (E3) component